MAQLDKPGLTFMHVKLSTLNLIYGILLLAIEMTFFATGFSQNSYETQNLLKKKTTKGEGGQKLPILRQHSLWTAPKDIANTFSVSVSVGFSAVNKFDWTLPKYYLSDLICMFRDLDTFVFTLRLLFWHHSVF